MPETTRFFMSEYEQELVVIDGLRAPIKRALQELAFSIRNGTAEEQALYQAIFSNSTKFGLGEAVLLVYHLSQAPNDLRTLGLGATDEQVQACVNNIKSELIALETARAGNQVVGLN